MKTYIFGHKNTDTDSMTSSIALSYLKNQLGENTVPCTLDKINKESQFILDYFNIKTPMVLDNVKTQVKDSNYNKFEGLNPNSSILEAFNKMIKNNFRILPIVDDTNVLKGLITMKDIAMSLTDEKLYSKLNTSLENIKNTLDGEILIDSKKTASGEIVIGAFYKDTLEKTDKLNDGTILIVGDRYDVIELAIANKVNTIVITGGLTPPKELLEEAKKNNISVVRTPKDTYTTSQLVKQSNFISSIMKVDQIISFREYSYLEDVKEIMKNQKHSNYPVVDKDNRYLGFINRSNILNPDKKKVILVDHNEYKQSVEGLEDADILEIIDHHKLGDISTSKPISFRNVPVGSTCTIVYGLYKEYGVEIPREIAGVLMSGILSDTLVLKSPTATKVDEVAIKELSKILDLDYEKYALKMFKAGTSIEGDSISSIVFRDFKEFSILDNKVGIGQIFTLDIESVEKRKDEMIKHIENVCEEQKFKMILVVVTDILKNGSYIYFNESVTPYIKAAYGQNAKLGTFIEDAVSRKKQFVPNITDAFEALEK